MNMMRKGQMHGVEKEDVRGQVALITTLFGVACAGYLGHPFRKSACYAQ